MDRSANAGIGRAFGWGTALFGRTGVAYPNADVAAAFAARRAAVAGQAGRSPEAGRGRQILVTRERVVHENDRLVHEISGETVWLRILIHISRQ